MNTSSAKKNGYISYSENRYAQLNSRKKRENRAKEVFEEIPIFADEKSIRSNEFYEAQRKGIKLDRMFVIKPYEYNYQTKIKYDNDIYTIERTYKKNTEELELICSKVK